MFSLAHVNPHLLYVPETVAWPKKDILGNRLHPSFEVESYGIAAKIDEFPIKISTASSDFYWNKILRGEGFFLFLRQKKVHQLLAGFVFQPMRQTTCRHPHFRMLFPELRKILISHSV